MLGIVSRFGGSFASTSFQKCALLSQSAQLLAAAPTTSHKGGAPAAAAGPDRKTLMDGGLSQVVKSVEKSSKEYADQVAQATKRWNEMHEVYYGKERDLVNFPLIKMPEYHPKVRMGVFPDSWFQAFYSKTGVTGPYLFFFGGISFLISKEIWVVDHQFVEVLPFIAVVAYIMKKYGHKINAYVYKEQAKANNLLYNNSINKVKKEAQEVIASVDKLVTVNDAVKDVFKAKRENIDFQLQAAYRERLEQVHKAVKSRLDYHIERDSARRQFQHQHMLNWILSNVMKSITPQQEKEALQQCIRDLKMLSTKVATTA